MHADFGGLLELTGLAIARIPAGVEVSFGWRLLKPIDREYWCFIHVVDEGNVIVGQMDRALTEFRPGEVIVETLRTGLPGGASKLRFFWLVSRAFGRTITHYFRGSTDR